MSSSVLQSIDVNSNRFDSPQSNHTKRAIAQQNGIKPSPLSSVERDTQLPCSPAAMNLFSPTRSPTVKSPAAASRLQTPESFITSPLKFTKSPTRSVESFASPLKFAKTPSPPKSLQEVIAAVAVIEPIVLETLVTAVDDTSLLQSDEEILSHSFALCAKAKEMLAQAQEEGQQDQKELEPIEATPDVEVVEPLPEAYETEAPMSLSEPLDSHTGETELTEAEEETRQMMEDALADEGAEEDELEPTGELEQAQPTTTEMDVSIQQSAEPPEQVDTCTNINCLALLDLSENLSLEVSELNTRYDNLQEEGARLYKQYEIKCAMLKATKTHNQNQHEYITQISKEHEELRMEYQELYHAYQELENLYNLRTEQDQHMRSQGDDDEQVQALQEENQNLRDMLVKLKPAAEDTETRMNQMLMEQEKIQETESVDNTKDQIIVQLKEELLSMRKELAETKEQSIATNTNEQSIVQTLEAELATTRTSLADVMNEKDSLAKELDSLRSTLQSNAASSRTQVDRELQSQAQAHAEEMVDAEREVAELTRALQTRTLAWEKAAQELVQAQEQSQAGQEKLEAANQEMESMRNELSAAHIQIDALKQELSVSQQTSIQRSEQISTIQKQLDAALEDLKEIPLLHTEFTKLEQIVEEKDAALQASINQIAQLEQKLQDQAAEQIAEVTRAAHEAELALALATDQQKESEGKIVALTSELSKTQKALVEERAKVTKMQPQVEMIPSLQASIATLKIDFSQLQTKNTQQSTLIASLEQQLREQFSQHAYDLKCSSGVTQELEQELKQVKEELDQLNKKYLQQKKKTDELRQQATEMAGKLAESSMAVAEANMIQSIPSTTSSAALTQARGEIDSLTETLMATRRENATLAGKLLVVEQLHLSEVQGFKSRLNIAQEEITLLKKSIGISNIQAKESEMNTLRQTLNETKVQLQSFHTQLEQTKTDKEQLLQQSQSLLSELEQTKLDKEQLLQQVELLMAAENNDGSELAALKSHNDELKAYLVSYKAAGDAKMSALNSTHTKLVGQASLLCQTLVQQGLVKRENVEVYKTVQQIAGLIKQPRAALQQTE